METIGAGNLTVNDDGPGKTGVSTAPLSVDHTTRDVISIVSGDNQSATVNTAVGNPLVVKVVDAYGNAVDGESVSYTVQTGGGSVAGSPALTNASAEAQPTSWTLGTTAGTDNNTLRAEIGGGSGKKGPWACKAGSLEIP